MKETKRKYSWDMDFDQKFEKDLEAYLSENKKEKTYENGKNKKSKKEGNDGNNRYNGKNMGHGKIKQHESKGYLSKGSQKPVNNRSKGKEGTDKAEITKALGYKPCVSSKKCGGCQLQGMSYQKQLDKKQARVNSLLKEYGTVSPIIGMKDPFHYRHKIHSTFSHDRKGNIISGVYEEGTHFVVPIESCMIQNELADRIIASIRNLCKSFKIKSYDEDTGFGLIRHVLIRVGYTSKEVMVVFVLSSPILPSKNNFVKALRELHPEISTVILNINGKNTSMVLGEREILLYGKGYIEDSLCDKVFRISAKSFYQVNPVQTEVLYKKAIEFADFKGNETLIDAYCGVGTIGIIMSDKVKQVYGVELNKDAVKDARVNAKRNEIKNIEFINADASDYMVSLAEQKEKIDVVVMDPPRTGSDERFLTSICQLAPKKVVYISCNPETLVRDLKFITKKGYKVEKMCPIDMFAFTEHVETVILMQYCGKEKK